MPTERADVSAGRSVVPEWAGRSLWLAAAWTGIGTALLAAIVSITVVAVCWLPASGTSGSAGSAIRAGLLTMLASTHSGITLDGTPTSFVPLAMTILLGLIAWRAGCALANAAEALGECRPGRLLVAAVLQAAAFAACCGLAARLATLGSSSVSVPAAGAASLLLFVLTGSVAFIRWSALGDFAASRAPGWVAPAARTSAAGVAVYLGAGSLLVSGALVLHRGRVEALSHLVGGGWSGVPVLLLGVLAAPNATIAATSYLAGPGFALGSGNAVGLTSTAHGTLPAFPVLGAVPSGHGATWPVWVFAVATLLAAGVCVAACAARFGQTVGRWRVLAGATALAAAAGVLLGWQGGGAIGSGRLKVIGASAWQLGLALGIEIGFVATIASAVTVLLGRLRARRGDARDHNVVSPARRALATVSSATTRLRSAGDDADSPDPGADDDELAG